MNSGLIELLDFDCFVDARGTGTLAQGNTDELLASLKEKVRSLTHRSNLPPLKLIHILQQHSLTSDSTTSSYAPSGVSSLPAGAAYSSEKVFCTSSSTSSIPLLTNVLFD